MRDMRRDLLQEAEAEVPHADAHGGGHEGLPGVQQGLHPLLRPQQPPGHPPEGTYLQPEKYLRQTSLAQQRCVMSQLVKKRTSGR